MKKIGRGWKIALAVFLSIVISFVVLAVTLGIIYIDDKNIQYQKFVTNHSSINDSSLKIVHLSDLHFPRIHVDLDGMLNQIRHESPDIIAITGDIVGSRSRVATSGAFEFAERLVSIAPVYYVNGNHEVNNSGGRELYAGLDERGVILLENRHINIEVRGVTVTLIGLFENPYGVFYDPASYNHEDISDNYIILLVHNPRLIWSQAVENSQVIAPDLILAGHVHGGQIRIFGTGILCPDRLFFPRFQTGMYLAENERGTSMIVSRGLGNSVVPFRFNCKPHVPVIEVLF